MKFVQAAGGPVSVVGGAILFVGTLALDVLLVVTFGAVWHHLFPLILVLIPGGMLLLALSFLLAKLSYQKMLRTGPFSPAD